MNIYRANLNHTRIGGEVLTRASAWQCEMCVQTVPAKYVSRAMNRSVIADSAAEANAPFPLCVRFPAESISYFVACTRGISTKCSLTNHIWSSLVRSTWLTRRSLVPSSPSWVARRTAILT